MKARLIRALARVFSSLFVANAFFTVVSSGANRECDARLDELLIELIKLTNNSE